MNFGQGLIACSLVLPALLGGPPLDAPGSGQPLPVPPWTGHVVDLTHTLTDEQQQEIERELAAFETRKGSQLAVLLVPSTQPETLEQYALRVAGQWQPGRAKMDDGAIVVVAKNERRVRIEVGDGLGGVLNDATRRRIIEAFITPRFREQKYAAGLHAGLQRMMAAMDGEPLPAPPGSAPPTDPLSEMATLLAAGALLGFVLREVLGRFPGTVMTAVIVGTFAWFLLGVLSLALIAGGITLLTTWLGLGALLRARRGPWGRRGSPGGGFKGGGGGLGGGGASDPW